MPKQKFQPLSAARTRHHMAIIGRTGRICRILLLACLLFASGQTQARADMYGGGYDSGPAPLYGATGNGQPASGQQQYPNLPPNYGQQPYPNLPPNYGQPPYQYQQQGTVNGTPGYAGTWQDPANGDTVTTIIAPRAPQQQMPQIIGAPGYYYDGYYNGQQGQYPNQNYGQQGHGGRPNAYGHGGHGQNHGHYGGNGMHR